jgi:hypothetical protein
MNCLKIVVLGRITSRKGLGWRRFTARLNVVYCTGTFLPLGIDLIGLMCSFTVKDLIRPSRCVALAVPCAEWLGILRKCLILKLFIAL